MELRDPLVSIAFLIFCIGFVAILAHFWNIFLAKKQQQAIAKFATGFDYIGFDGEIKDFLSLSQNPLPQVLFMAKMYQKGGDFERAIRLYVTLLDSLKSPADRVPVLEQLGALYSKAGFLLRAKEIYTEILHYYPRKPVILDALLHIFFELKDYEGAQGVLDCLEELQGENALTRAFLRAKTIMAKSPKNACELQEIMAKEPALSRIILSFLRNFYPKAFWDGVQGASVEFLLENLDLLWSADLSAFAEFLPDLCANGGVIFDVLQARGVVEISAQKKASFELDVLCTLRKCGGFKADLSFKYQCKACKATSPLSFERCPHCGALAKLKAIATIKEKNETRYSLL